MSGTTSGSDSHKFVVYAFFGSKEKFQDWKVKMLSLACVHKVSRYLTIQIVIEVLNDTSEEYKKYKKNVKAYDLLIRSCTGVPLGLLELVEEGNAHEAWKKLLNKYETSEEDVQELEEKWTNFKLNSIATDPTV